MSDIPKNGVLCVTWENKNSALVMAGRGGRGRGRGKNISFNVESLGFGRGEALPTPILQPPPTYPVRRYVFVRV